ncbi:MAG: serine hydrolase domain-containing protein [Hyphomicrobium sp.]
MRRAIGGLASVCALIGFLITPVAAQEAQSSKSGIVQGMSVERLGWIATSMDREIAKGVFPGAVTLIARRGEIVHFAAHGYLDAAKTKPMNKDSIFRFASMTKAIVTTAAMMLVEQGIIKLNDPVADYLPELKDLKVEVAKTDASGRVSYEDVPADKPITIQDLMRHTSGFFYTFTVKSPRLKQAYEAANIEGSDADISGDEMLKRLHEIPLANQPATNFLYSVSIDVLGLLLERVTKQPLDVLLQDTLIGPLGMTDTAFWVPAEKADRIAEVPDSDPLKKLSLRFCRTQDEIKKSYLKGGAGLCGTAQDYFKFLQMIANGGEYEGKRYLSKKTVEFMLQNHLVGMGGSTESSTGPGYGFGLGFAVRLQDGFGWSPGSKGDVMWAGLFGTSFSIDPKEQLVFILLTQGATARLQSRHLFKNLVYGAVVE